MDSCLPAVGDWGSVMNRTKSWNKNKLHRYCVRLFILTLFFWDLILIWYGTGYTLLPSDLPNFTKQQTPPNPLLSQRYVFRLGVTLHQHCGSGIIFFGSASDLSDGFRSHINFKFFQSVKVFFSNFISYTAKSFGSDRIRIHKSALYASPWWFCLHRSPSAPCWSSWSIWR